MGVDDVFNRPVDAPHYERLVYGSEFSFLSRFDAFKALGWFRPEHKVLDIGCGLASVVEYLGIREQNYLGIDINAQFCAEAAVNYPGSQFLHVDFTDVSRIGRWDHTLRVFGADWVFLFGTLITHASYRHALITVQRAFGFCSQGLVISAVHPYVRFHPLSSEHPVLISPSDLLSFAATLTPCLDLRMGYKPNDFLLTLLKRHELLFADQHLAKYRHEHDLP